MALFRRERAADLTQKNVAANRATHQDARAQRLGKLVARGDLLAVFGVDAEEELSRFRYRQNTAKETISASELLTERLRCILSHPRIGWHVMQKFPVLETDTWYTENMAKDKAIAREYMARLPAGTKVAVAAAYGAELAVQHAAGSTELLHWPYEAQGYLWLPADLPKGVAHFRTGNANFGLRFSETNEPVLFNDSKTIVLTSHETGSGRNDPEDPDYQLAFGLPEAYERTYQLPRLYEPYSSMNPPLW